MADDRLFLRCKECGATILFYKWYVEGGYMSNKKVIEQWLREHLLLCDGRQDFEMQAPVEIITEAQKAKT